MTTVPSSRSCNVRLRSAKSETSRTSGVSTTLPAQNSTECTTREQTVDAAAVEAVKPYVHHAHADGGLIAAAKRVPDIDERNGRAEDGEKRPAEAEGRAGRGRNEDREGDEQQRDDQIVEQEGEDAARAHAVIGADVVEPGWR